MTEKSSRRNPRLRLACARCQRRKIKCDAQFPTCSNCKKASAICTDGESIRLLDVPRNRTVSQLKRRIAWLQSIIRERLPDVDLSEDPAPVGMEVDVDEAELDIDEAEGSSVQDGRRESSTVDARFSRQHTAPTQLPGLLDQRAHEIGLVAVGLDSDQRYIGPSSGYFLARMLFTGSPKRSEPPERSGRVTASISQTLINELVEATQGPLPLPLKSHAVRLCRTYFEVIHPQYPILHEPSFDQTLDKLYNEVGESAIVDPNATFQIFMVLAISSTILSGRSKCQIPGESYCLAALQYFDRLSVESSLSGLQCLLLLLIYTMQSPLMKLNIWYLNYQCIAALLDLGLQRKITTSSGISLLHQEMRTRVFWVALTLDRTIATMTGRPIGLRDEACDLRLPQCISDHDLVGAPNLPQNSNSCISFSIHLCKLAKLNSEIKYVANSVVRAAPSYAYHPIGEDIHAWQRNMLNQLDQWATDIPQHDPSLAYIGSVCLSRYYNMKMLLLRPSPAIPKPSTESLSVCYDSACRLIQLFHQLYRQDMLIHDWMTLHGVLFGTITLLYCIRAVPDIANSVELDVLASYLGMSISILSASGEHWTGAKRSRDIVDDLGRSTIRWIRGLKTSAVSNNANAEGPFMRESQQATASFTAGPSSAGTMDIEPYLNPDLAPSLTSVFSSNGFSDMQCQDGFWYGTSSKYGFGDTVNVEDIMQNLFNDFIPQINNFSNEPESYPV